MRHIHVSRVSYGGANATLNISRVQISKETWMQRGTSKMKTNGGVKENRSDLKVKPEQPSHKTFTFPYIHLCTQPPLWNFIFYSETIHVKRQTAFCNRNHTLGSLCFFSQKKRSQFNLKKPTRCMKLEYLQDPKLILHPSIPLLSIILCPMKEEIRC